MSVLRSLRQLGRRLGQGFWHDTRGAMPIEGLFGSVLLLGWFMISYQFFESFRHKGLATRAAHTVADLVSRETQSIGPKYVAGLAKVYDFVADSKIDSWIRVTLIHWDANAKAYRVDKSYATDNKSLQTNSTLLTQTNRIPVLAEGDTAIIIETQMEYDPIFSIGDKALSLNQDTTGQNIFTRVGLGSGIKFSNFVVTRPRGTKIVWNDTK
ncbi:TadE/TadG family type IV pilus assembly protein [Phaeovulum sp. W22_SRMD_FR3]|uniref:TadE/TadG family type IV pilus assembly protein n=1 Tax=Phaeovulum sp. W22_SRMD_FR3 TaxID=3240274 RepID=UPI003F9BA38F